MKDEKRSSQNIESDEELREKQRRDAIYDEEEYDINNGTYEAAPITRRYVKDDAIRKGGYGIADDTSLASSPSIIIDDVGMEESEEWIPENSAASRNEPANDNARETLLGEPSKKEYIDRTMVLGAEESETGCAQKKITIRKKDRNVRKDGVERHHFIMAAIILAIALVISAVLFVVIAGMVSAQQKADQQKNAFIQTVTLVSKTIDEENNAYNALVNATNEYMIGLANTEGYYADVSSCVSDLNNILYSYKNSVTMDLFNKDLISNVIDYITCATTASDSIINALEAFMNGEEERKISISDACNSLGSKRNIAYENILQRIVKMADELGIATRRVGNTIRFDVALEK